MGEQKKVVLIFPNFYLYDTFSGIPHQPSLSLAYLFSSIKKSSSHLPYIIDAAAERLTLSETMRRISEINPDFIGITTNVTIAYSALCLSAFLKTKLKHLKIILGGAWATAEYEYVLRHQFADFVVMGEGELTLIDLLNVENISDSGRLKSINGLAFKTKEGEIIVNPPREHMKNLEDLPIPLWEQFPKKGYTRTSREKRCYPVQTSRGCPYLCINCTKIIHGTQIRYRPINHILMELDYIKSIGGKEIAIEDDIFNFNLKRAKRILFEIIKRNYGFRIQFSNGLRADKIDDLFAKLLRAAGTYKVALGIESGNQRIVNSIKKKLDLKMVKHAVDLLKKNDINVFGYFIMGLPGENYQSMLYSIKFAEMIDVDVMVLMKLVVFPKTPLHELLINDSTVKFTDMKVIPNLNYQYSKIQYSSENINESVLKKVQNYYLIHFYFNFKRLMKMMRCYTLSDLFNQLKIQFFRLIKNIFFVKPL